MLPEVLSNGVCSLQERQPRLTKSLFITYSRQGKVKKTRVASSIIRSTKRLTYEQATAVLDGKPGRTSAKVVALLKDMERLARAIRVRRLREGMLELDLPEIELVHDEDGNVIGVEPADTSFSHKIIEMFMVEANEAVARLLASHKVPHLRRIHDEPRHLATGGLRRFLAILGHELPANADRFAIQALLDKVRGKSEAFAVHLAVLRSMQQAEYAPTLVGHYALASEHYCHFTSPIRRYPDLAIHRLIDLYLRDAFRKPNGVQQVPGEEELAELGSLCSANEQRAEAAERELKLVLVLRLLEKRLGDEFGGVVTGVANVGVFVQLERYLLEGLLRFEHLLDDWWEVDPTHGCVVGQRSGYRITVGHENPHTDTSDGAGPGRAALRCGGVAAQSRCCCSQGCNATNETHAWQDNSTGADKTFQEDTTHHRGPAASGSTPLTGAFMTRSERSGGRKSPGTMWPESRGTLLFLDGLTSPLPGVTVIVCPRKAASYTWTGPWRWSNSR
jgi:ribonuclease R